MDLDNDQNFHKKLDTRQGGFLRQETQKWGRGKGSKVIIKDAGLGEKEKNLRRTRTYVTGFLFDLEEVGSRAP